MSKEHNFISAVVYIQDDDQNVPDFFQMLYDQFDDHFLQFELIAVSASKNYNDTLRDWSKKISKPLTIVNMSHTEPHEQCMNAGLDIAIGDYVYEFDSVGCYYDVGLIWNAYETALNGNDIVSVCPKREDSMSHLFYTLFNANSRSPYKLRTDAFRLVSRRALNRAHAISENLPYRKATYATCGLKMEVLEFEGKLPKVKKERAELAIDSLVLYTDFGYKFSLGLTLLMFCGTFLELVYTIIERIVGNPVSGWASTVFVITLGFTGLFAILAFALKYLTLLLKLVFRKQYYLTENIEKF